MTDGEGFTITYLAHDNFGDWPNQLRVHCSTHGHMLQVGQCLGGKTSYCQSDEAIYNRHHKSSLILLDRVTKEDVGLPQWSIGIQFEPTVRNDFSES